MIDFVGEKKEFPNVAKTGNSDETLSMIYFKGITGVSSSRLLIQYHTVLDFAGWYCEAGSSMKTGVSSHWAVSSSKIRSIKR